MSAIKLALQDINKFYGPPSTGVHAVKDFSMDVMAGEIVALLGSSGCGKTSTLRMIAGFENVSRGQILLNGSEIHELPPVARNVAMAFEGYSLYPTVTVGENIGFALKSRRFTQAEIDDQVREIAEMLEIEDILNRSPLSISGGQQQRTSLARALIREAALYLLDEPMGQLEPQLRTLLRGRIKHFIKERELTAILVTHDQTEANALADKIAVMDNGELQQFSTPQDIKGRPANLFTGTFVGEPPMNVYEATFLSSQKNVILELDGGFKLAYDKALIGEQIISILSKRKRFVIGIRPYAVRGAQNGINASVVACQWLGDQTHISARFGDKEIVFIEHDHSQLSPGDNITLELPAQFLHFFESDTGRAIIQGSEIVR